jgi:phosphinothricin acetyltransferase
MSDVCVRPATPADLPGIHEIYNEAVRNTTATYDYEPRDLVYRERWFEEHVRERYPVFVAVGPEARVLGWSSLSQYRERRGYRFTAENSVYVAADQRGKGIGRLLLPPLIASARRRGLHVIVAAIDAQNEASVRLHASFGFQKVGLFREVGHKFGRWLDVLYMQLLV